MRNRRKESLGRKEEKKERAYHKANAVEEASIVHAIGGFEYHKTYTGEVGKVKKGE